MLDAQRGFTERLADPSVLSLEALWPLRVVVGDYDRALFTPVDQDAVEVLVPLGLSIRRFSQRRAILSSSDRRNPADLDPAVLHANLERRLGRGRGAVSDRAVA